MQICQKPSREVLASLHVRQKSGTKIKTKIQSISTKKKSQSISIKIHQQAVLESREDKTQTIVIISTAQQTFQHK
jgi:hypothetical protein